MRQRDIEIIIENNNDNIRYIVNFKTGYDDVNGTSIFYDKDEMFKLLKKLIIEKSN